MNRQRNDPVRLPMTPQVSRNVSEMLRVACYSRSSTNVEAQRRLSRVLEGGLAYCTVRFWTSGPYAICHTCGQGAQGVNHRVRRPGRPCPAVEGMIIQRRLL